MVSPDLAGDGEALPAASLRFLQEQLDSLYGGGAVVAEARAGAGVVQVEDGVEARRLALLDMGRHARGQCGSVGSAQGPVVEVARPMLMGQAHRSDDGDTGVQTISGAPQRKCGVEALDAVRQAERNRAWTEQAQNG